jgi:probable HAF family extracellular repeat protein
MRTKALAILALLLVSTASAAPVYDVIDLGTLGGDSSRAWSINNNAQVVGYADNSSSVSRATLFDSTGSGNNIDLGSLGGSYSYAFSINNNGQIVGRARNSRRRGLATLFDSTGSRNNIDLGTLGGIHSWAYSINNNGQIAGSARYGSSSFTRATLFDSTGNGFNIDLGALSQESSVAYSINDNNQIVGLAYDASGDRQAMLFDYTGNANNIELGTLGGIESWARSINDNGQVVGSAYNGSGQQRATLFDPTGNGNNIDLGALDGNYSEARSINNNGQIVGWAWNVVNQYRATLFDSTGSGNNIDLNTLIEPGLGWTLEQAWSINDNGWIVGYGINPNGYSRAFLLTPEPAMPPIADADGPYSIYVGDTLTLDASGSTDDDNDIVSYMWDLNDDGSFETDAGGQAVFDVNYPYLQSLGLIVGGPYDIHVQVTDSEEQSDTDTSTLTILASSVIEAVVDIKPRSCPNPLNLKSSGVLPVAILGTEDVNVITIDPNSIGFSIGDVNVGAIRYSYEDVAAPVSDENECNCTEDGPDGYTDLTLKFETQAIVEALGQVTDGEEWILLLTGVLHDDTPIEGADCIIIRSKSKPGK